MEAENVCCRLWYQVSSVIDSSLCRVGDKPYLIMVVRAPVPAYSCVTLAEECSLVVGVCWLA